MVESVLPQKPGVAGIVVTARDLGHGARLKSASFSGRRPRLMLIVLAGSLTVGLAGCRGGEPGGSTTTAPSVSAPVRDARGTAEELALDAYRGMWRAYAKAGLAANPDDPELARYAADQALKTLTDGLKSIKSRGEVLKGEYGSSPQVVGASPAAQPASVQISDCLDGTNFLTYKATGELADDEPGGRRSTTATVTNFGADGWKVAGFAIQKVGTC
jgi:hypothetical protein